MADTSIAPLSSISGSSDPEAAVRVKANPKGGFSLTGDTALTAKDNAELLANMEAMIKERQSPLNLLMSGLKDAAAWGSGGIRGPSEALRSRDEQKQLEAKELFNMRSEMAARRSAQTSAESRAKSLRGEVSGGAASGVAPGETAAPSRLAPPPRVVNEINRLLSLDPPDLAGAEAIQKEYIKNESKFDSTRHEQKPYYINPEIGNVTMDPEQAEYFKRTNILPDGTKVKPPSAQQTRFAPTENAAVAQTTVPSASGVNTYNVGNVRPQGASTGFQQPVDYKAGLQIMDDNLSAYGKKGINTLEGIINRWAPPVDENGKVINDTASYIKTAAQRLGLDPKQQIDLSNPAVRQAVGTAIMLHEKGPKGVFTSAPAQNVSLPSQRAELSIAKTAPAGNADLPYPVPRNAEQVNANQKFIEARGTKSLEIASKGPEKASTEAGTRQAQMFKLNEDADDAIKAADQVIAVSKNFPETTGLGKGFTGANIATTAISALPKMDQNKAEDRYASFILTKPGQQAARDQVDTASKQLGISFAADVFKGARLGIGLENMAAGAKGVSVHNLAENNLINATIIKEAALFNKARTQLFDEWAPANGGKMADFEKFETSPQYNALKEQTQKRIVDGLPNYLKLGKNGLEEINATKKSNSENSARAELERRKKAKESQ